MGCLLLALVAASLATADGRLPLASKKRQKAKAAPAAEVRTVNATEADFDYRWRAPIVRGWQRGNKKHVRIRGIMNTGTNFLRTLLNKVGGLKITEERKHMFPWVLEQRGAAYQNSVAVVIARHPLSWITGMRKAPYFLDCKSEDPDATCWMRLVWKENNRPEKIEKSYASIIDVWNAYYSAYLDWRGSADAASYFYFSRHFPAGWTLIRYEDLLLDADRTMRELFPGRVDETMHLQTDRAAKGHGHARSFADARAYNLAKMWRKEKPAIRRPRGSRRGGDAEAPQVHGARHRRPLRPRERDAPRRPPVHVPLA